MSVQPSTVLDEYITYVKLERNYSSYTVTEYTKDIEEFFSFITVEGHCGFKRCHVLRSETLCNDTL